MSKLIPGNQKHLTLDDRIFIEKELEKGSSFKSIAIMLCKDPTTISKEVKKHRSRSAPTPFFSRNVCSFAFTCKKTNICKKRYDCTTLCRSCKHARCNKVCSDFTRNDCIKIKRAPFVCSACPSKRGCRLSKFFYKATSAQRTYERSLTETRKGINLSQEEFNSLDLLVSPLIQKGQPLAHIFAHHEHEIPCSRRALYNYLSMNILQARNLDLPRRVAFKPRRHSAKPTPRALDSLLGRSYYDFSELLSINPEIPVVEMDTVEGAKGGKVLLTFFFRQSHLMLAFLMPDKTQNSVLKVFNQIEDKLGTDVFSKTFPMILTDNGSEFLDPYILEDNADGKLRTSIFYCEPRAAFQKGALERNHEFIRYFSAQGKSFDNYTQADITRMINHINSTARDGLNGLTPFKLASLFWDPIVLKALNLKRVPPDKVTLRPVVLKKKDF